MTYVLYAVQLNNYVDNGGFRHNLNDVYGFKSNCLQKSIWKYQIVSLKHRSTQEND